MPVHVRAALPARVAAGGVHADDTRALHTRMENRGGRIPPRSVFVSLRRAPCSARARVQEKERAPRASALHLFAMRSALSQSLLFAPLSLSLTHASLARFGSVQRSAQCVYYISLCMHARAHSLILCFCVVVCARADAI